MNVYILTSWISAFISFIVGATMKMTVFDLSHLLAYQHLAKEMAFVFVNIAVVSCYVCYGKNRNWMNY